MVQTEGTGRLRSIVDGSSLSEVARRLTANGAQASASNVRGWTRGRRPREAVRFVLKSLYGIPAEAWLTTEERRLSRFAR
jgi:hypothetical protein